MICTFTSTDDQTCSDALVKRYDLDRSTYEQTLAQALRDVRESLDERISREQLERLMLESESHPLDALESLQRLALMVATDVPCPRCGDFNCRVCA